MKFNSFFSFFLLFSFSFSYCQNIAVGDSYSYSICNDGTVMSWGSNYYGQLGDSTTTYRKLPVKVKNLTNVIAISGGAPWSSNFLKNDGTVWASGSNTYGQLGNNTVSSQTTTVVPVLGLTGITAIAAGEHHKLFLKNDSTVWACGYNGFGQLGDSSTTNRDLAVQVKGLTGIVAIAGGWQHSLFLKSDGSVWACGRNYHGQLGDSTTTDRNTPVKVLSVSGIKAISAGIHHSFFLKSDSTVMACGYNGFGQLGDGTNTDKIAPIQIPNLDDVIQISGGGHSLFLKSDGTVWACGINNYGQLGDGTTVNKNTPFQISGLTGIVSVAGWIYHSIFLKNDGTVWACGWNSEGQLGDGTIVDKSTPVKTKNLCVVEVPVSLNESSNFVNEVKLYPNPTNGKIQISNSKSQIERVEVYNIIGERIFQTTNSQQLTTIDLSSQPNGIYFVEFTTDEGKIRKKIIKQ